MGQDRAKKTAGLTLDGVESWPITVLSSRAVLAVLSSP